MADVSRSLSDYLAAIGRRRWQPGVLDCGVFMADWVRAITGLDPIADVRGSYSTEKQFMRIVRREGGFEAAVARRLAAVGFHATAVATAGDIAVVLAPYAIRRGKIQHRPTGAIAVDATQRAVVTSDLGLVIAPLPQIMAYRHHG
jgi:hypothetical protein